MNSRSELLILTFINEFFASNIHRKWERFENLGFPISCLQQFCQLSSSRKCICHQVLYFGRKVLQSGREDRLLFMCPSSAEDVYLVCKRNIKRIILHYAHKYIQIFVRKYIINKTLKTVPTCFNLLIFSSSPPEVILLNCLAIHALEKQFKQLNGKCLWISSTHFTFAIKCFCRFMSWTLLRLALSNGQQRQRCFCMPLQQMPIIRNSCSQKTLQTMGINY